MLQHDLISKLGYEMSEQIVYSISYETDKREVNVLKNGLPHKNHFSNDGNYTKHKLLP